MFINEYGNENDPLVLRPGPGFQYCGYMAAHLKEYGEEIETFIRRQQNVLG